MRRFRITTYSTPCPSANLPTTHFDRILYFFFFTQAMASEVFYKIVKAIKACEPEQLEFANLEPEDSALILKSLLDPKNGLDEIYHHR